VAKLICHTFELQSIGSNTETCSRGSLAFLNVFNVCVIYMSSGDFDEGASYHHVLFIPGDKCQVNVNDLLFFCESFHCKVCVS